MAGMNQSHSPSSFYTTLQFWFIKDNSELNAWSRLANARAWGRLSWLVSLIN